jgi:peptidoglycan/LPS O-acetylase OafA/YrhL
MPGIPIVQPLCDNPKSPDITQTNSAKLDGLTTLRFFAAFYVFLFHFDSRIAASLPQFIKNIVSNGAIAMPVFFMLSGFVLGYRYHNTYKGFNSYYLARISRIVPAYMLCVLISIPLLADFGSLQDISYLMGVGFALILSILIAQAWYPNLFEFWHFAGTWSISVEMFLYACFPVVRALSRYSSRTLILVAIIFTLFSASLLPSNKLSISNALEFPVFYAIPAYHLPEFVIGFVISQLYLRHGANRLLFLGFPILLISLGMLGDLNYRYMTLNILILPLVALTIYGFASLGSVRATTFDRLINNKLFIYLGQISYSFFLLQIPIMVWLGHHKDTYQHISTPTLFAVTLGTTTALAMFSYHFVENNGRQLILLLAQKRNHQNKLLHNIKSFFHS